MLGLYGISYAVFEHFKFVLMYLPVWGEIHNRDMAPIFQSRQAWKLEERPMIQQTADRMRSIGPLLTASNAQYNPPTSDTLHLRKTICCYLSPALNAQITGQGTLHKMQLLSKGTWRCRFPPLYEYHQVSNILLRDYKIQR